MCKFQEPQVADKATDDERRAAYFDALNSLDMSDKVEKIQNLSYISWSVRSIAKLESVGISTVMRIKKQFINQE